VTAAEAKRYVWQVVASSLKAEVDNGSAWLYEDLDDKDIARVQVALKEVAASIEAKIAGKKPRRAT
jgi:hypothetical protein